MYMLSFLQRFSDSFKIHEQLKCTLAAIYEYVYPLIQIPIRIPPHTHIHPHNRKAQPTSFRDADTNNKNAMKA